MSGLDELIARLESAEHGDRKLDWAIREVVATVHIPFNPDPRCWAGVGADGLIYRAPERGGSTNDRYLPFYTTSLHAALALVPEDWTAWEMRSRGAKTRFVAELLRLNAEDREDFVSGRAPTPALAVCIAALKARAA